MHRRDVILGDLQQRLTSGMHLGRLRTGERLGSARQTARDAGADYRTVVGALRGLEREGLLEIRPRGGIYVGGEVQRQGEAVPACEDRIVDLALEVLAAGGQVPALGERLMHCLDTARLRAACIECNEDQLYFLRDELRGRFGLAGEAVEIARLRGGVPLAVRQADVLVSTCFHAGVVRHLASRLGKPFVLVTLDPRRREEVTRALAEGPVYFVGTDSRWAAKARVIWGGEPGAERLHAITLGPDSPTDVPQDAAVMLMPRARAWLGDDPLVGRALPHRGFSAETAREIVSFVVRANAPAARR
jgi:DNA-binding transcriptional regulator YhcF (GntR family)